MKLNKWAITSAVILAISAQAASAAKVGDKCTPKGGGAGHFVASRAAGLPTIKCKADAAIKANTNATVKKQN